MTGAMRGGAERRGAMQVMRGGVQLRALTAFQLLNCPGNHPRT